MSRSSARETLVVGRYELQQPVGILSRPAERDPHSYEHLLPARSTR